MHTYTLSPPRLRSFREAVLAQGGSQTALAKARPPWLLVPTALEHGGFHLVGKWCFVFFGFVGRFFLGFTASLVDNVKDSECDIKRKLILKLKKRRSCDLVLQYKQQFSLSFQLVSTFFWWNPSFYELKLQEIDDNLHLKWLTLQRCRHLWRVSHLPSWCSEGVFFPPIDLAWWEVLWLMRQRDWWTAKDFAPDKARWTQLWRKHVEACGAWKEG